MSGRRHGVSLALQCRAARLPEPEAEARFHPTRRWKFDYLFRGFGLAVEVQGGNFVRGRHVQGAALIQEYEKLNAAAALGYRIIFVTPRQVANGQALAAIEAALTPAALMTAIGAVRAIEAIQASVARDVELR